MAPNTYRNWLRTLGAPEDPVATDTTSEWSLVSLVKALYLKVSDGSFAGAVTGRAESLVGLCQSAALQVAAYARSAKSSKLAASTSASNAATSETNAATSASTASTQSGLATASAQITAGFAIFGQHAHRDRIAAAASAAAAAASAASVPTVEQSVLGIHVYS